MQMVGIRDLRGRLATLVRAAGAGERVVITIDGRPVAQLCPLGSDDEGASLADLAARGEIRLAARSDRPPPSVTTPTWVGVRLDRLVREVRGR